jgi:hypothetical protein
MRRPASTSPDAALLSAVESDPRRFDAEVVRSVLETYNSVYLEAPFGEFMLDRGAPALAWIPEVLTRRLREVGLSETAGYVGPVHKTCGDELLKAISRLAVFFQSIVPANEVPGLVLDARELRRRGHAKAAEAREQWLDRALRAMPSAVYYRFLDGVVVREEVPMLNTVERCVAYGLMVLLRDEDMRSRVCVCPFTGRGQASPHYFLNYRVERDGSLARGTTPRFCSQRHKTAFHVRESRK